VETTTIKCPECGKDINVSEIIRLQLEVELKKQIEEENLNKIKLLNDELNKKSDELKDLNKTKIEIEQLKRDKDELATKITLEKEKE
jgi:uncharacterized Zn finger protein (UPF0148 family)